MIIYGVWSDDGECESSHGFYTTRQLAEAALKELRADWLKPYMIKTGKRKGQYFKFALRWFGQCGEIREHELQ